RGYYEVPLDTANHLIKISHVGFVTEELHLPQPPGSTVNVYLVRANNMLEDVYVNTGYERVPKERSTGSFELIDSAELTRSISTNILDRLEDMSTAVLFDRTQYDINSNIPIKIDLRGKSSIFSDSKPLIILDNFPYEGDIANLSPDQIESI